LSREIGSGGFNSCPGHCHFVPKQFLLRVPYAHPTVVDIFGETITLGQVKNMVEVIYGIPEAHQLLMWEGKTLTEKRFTQLSFPFPEISVSLRLSGGSDMMEDDPKKKKQKRKPSKNAEEYDDDKEPRRKEKKISMK